MATELMAGQILRGRAGSYALDKQIYRGVWRAKNFSGESVIVKSVRHWRIQNERDVLRRLQHRSAYVRPIIDEIESPADPPALVLRWLDDDVLRASKIKRLTKPEIKQVAKSVLEALSILHEEGLIHTDIKPRNILVNYRYGSDRTRFQEVQLADFGGAIHQDSHYAKEGHDMGTELWRSPEAQMNMAVGPSSDIFSFGATLLSLLFGGTYHAFEPNIPEDDPQYSLQVLMKHYRILGPWPVSLEEIADRMRIEVMAHIAELSPRETLRPLAWVEDDEISEDDRRFLLKVLKLDPRDRPSAKELLEDEWFQEDSSTFIVEAEDPAGDEMVLAT